ncbi:hypothetical protein BKA63DRAFT_494864 [Paraphoma chrysanthemicola]|nr:hypothetical protein BKA63DRAFT_494864 [Paraphoma chrysanthemicola]
MDVSIQLDHPNTTFTNGDTIHGKIVVYSPNKITVSKLTVCLTGESVLSIRDTNGILGNWKQQEKHRFIHERQVIVPHRTDESQHRENIKLDFGYHSFWFSLKIPDSPDCCSCPPNSPVFQSGIEKQGSRSGDLPPSMKHLIEGVDVSYRTDVAITTLRSVFKSTLTKTLPITVWPVDPQLPLGILPASEFLSVDSTTAKILGPPTSLPPNTTTRSPQDPYLISSTHETAELLITAHFLPDFTLTHGRHVVMHLDVTQLNSTSHDLYLQSFQMLILGYTDIRVGTATHTDLSRWTVASRSNLERKLFSAHAELGSDCHINSDLWEGKNVDTAVVPSFEACGVARRYEVEILMGFQCKGGATDKVGRVLFVQLRTPMRISSGLYVHQRFSMARHAETRDSYIGNEAGVPSYVANGLRYTGRDECDGCVVGEMQQFPPTYDEAVRVGIDRDFEDEKRRYGDGE